MDEFGAVSIGQDSCKVVDAQRRIEVSDLVVEICRVSGETREEQQRVRKIELGDRHHELRQHLCDGATLATCSLGAPQHATRSVQRPAVTRGADSTRRGDVEIAHGDDHVFDGHLAGAQEIVELGGEARTLDDPRGIGGQDVLFEAGPRLRVDADTWAKSGVEAKVGQYLDEQRCTGPTGSGNDNFRNHRGDGVRKNLRLAHSLRMIGVQRTSQLLVVLGQARKRDDFRRDCNLRRNALYCHAHACAIQPTTRPVTTPAGLGRGVTRQLRVLWLIKGLGPGGAEHLLVAAARSRDTEHFSYELAYLLPWKNALVPELEALGVATTCFGVRDERDLRWMLALRSRLRNSPVDVVHVHSPYVAAMARLVIATMSRLKRPAIVSTEHNAWTGFKAPTRYANAWTARMDAATIAVSEETRGSMSARQRDRCETLVHGIDIARVGAYRAERQEVRDEFGFRDDEIVIGTVANYHPKKDWPNLLNAASLVMTSAPNVRFLAVGQGPLQHSVEELHRELGLVGVVTLTGYRPDAARLMAGCDVFMLASKWEGLPVAVMEALALGLPIVSTAVGGVAETFVNDQDALLVPSGDAPALAATIVRVANDPTLRARLGAASLQRSFEFDAERAQRRIESIYEKVAGTPR